eukprot:GILK01011167.1.p1 GENE.GILK01011167.1~~GILK01011167.1.p1  ORF type:complete len:171 (+),score=2.81 GILK01011167.1:60-572(+)
MAALSAMITSRSGFRMVPITWRIKNFNTFATFRTLPDRHVCWTHPKHWSDSCSPHSRVAFPFSSTRQPNHRSFSVDPRSYYPSSVAAEAEEASRSLHRFPRAATYMFIWWITSFASILWQFHKDPKLEEYLSGYAPEMTRKLRNLIPLAKQEDEAPSDASDPSSSPRLDR